MEVLSATRRGSTTITTDTVRRRTSSGTAPTISTVVDPVLQTTVVNDPTTTPQISEGRRMGDTREPYVGTYDKNETTRIDSLLNDQRDILLAEEKKLDKNDEKIKMYFLILVGLSAIVITLKVIKK